MPQFEKKLTLSVFYPMEGCPLNHSDLLVFSYLAYQDRYQTFPAYRTTARRTGLNEKTVADSCGRLAELGLIKDSRFSPEAVPADWFRLSGRNFGPHLSQRLVYWVSWVRAATPDNPLSVPAVSVYSYLRSKIEEHFTPKYGWSQAYIAKVLNLDAHTVHDSLTVLSAAELLSYCNSPLKLKLREVLSEDQLSYFAAPQAREEGGSVGFEDSPAADVGFADSEVAPMAFFGYIGTLCPRYNELQRDAMANKVWLRLNNTVRNWRTNPDWKDLAREVTDNVKREFAAASQLRLSGNTSEGQPEPREAPDSATGPRTGPDTGRHQDSERTGSLVDLPQESGSDNA
jgi:hypothetical protein